MSVTSDIVESYAAPGRVVRRKLENGPREDRALATLMGALGLSFVAEWPGLMHAAATDPSVPLDARIGGALMGLMFLAPLIAYGLAALLRLGARAAGLPVDWFSARLVLFWAMLVTSPLMLILGLAAGFAGPGFANLGGFVVLAVFLWVLGGGFRAAVQTGRGLA
jgi:hypothetical protein